MTKTYFEFLIEQHLSDEDFEKIANVYMRHPVIGAGKFGMQQLANIYISGGMLTIEDMYERWCKDEAEVEYLKEYCEAIEKLPISKKMYLLRTVRSLAEEEKKKKEKETA